MSTAPAAQAALPRLPFPLVSLVHKRLVDDFEGVVSPAFVNWVASLGGAPGGSDQQWSVSSATMKASRKASNIAASLVHSFTSWSYETACTAVLRLRGPAVTQRSASSHRTRRHLERLEARRRQPSTRGRRHIGPIYPIGMDPTDAQPPAEVAFPGALAASSSAAPPLATAVLDAPGTDSDGDRSVTPVDLVDPRPLLGSGIDVAAYKEDCAPDSCTTGPHAIKYEGPEVPAQIDEDEGAESDGGELDEPEADFGSPSGD